MSSLRPFPIEQELEAFTEELANLADPRHSGHVIGKLLNAVLSKAEELSDEHVFRVRAAAAAAAAAVAVRTWSTNFFLPETQAWIGRVAMALLEDDPAQGYAAFRSGFFAEAEGVFDALLPFDQVKIALWFQELVSLGALAAFLALAGQEGEVPVSPQWAYVYGERATTDFLLKLSSADVEFVARLEAKDAADGLAKMGVRSTSLAAVVETLEADEKWRECMKRFPEATFAGLRAGALGCVGDGTGTGGGATVQAERDPHLCVAGEER